MRIDQLRAGVALLDLAGALQQARQQLDEAVVAARGAVAVAEEHPLHGFQVDALMVLGLALTQSERFPESIFVFERAAAVARSSDARADEGRALLMLGALLVDARRLEESITVNRKAVRILQEVGDRKSAQRATQHLNKALALLGRR